MLGIGNEREKSRARLGAPVTVGKQYHYPALQTVPLPADAMDVQRTARRLPAGRGMAMLPALTRYVLSPLTAAQSVREFTLAPFARLCVSDSSPMRQPVFVGASSGGIAIEIPSKTSL